MARKRLTKRRKALLDVWSSAFGEAARLEKLGRRFAAVCVLDKAAAKTAEDEEIAEQLHHEAEMVRERFRFVCSGASRIKTPTPNRSPFHSYDVYRNRKRMRGVQPTAKRAVEHARLYKKEVVVTGITLSGERHTVLVVNEYGEVTFLHPQFKVKLSGSGGVA